MRAIAVAVLAAGACASTLAAADPVATRYVRTPKGALTSVLPPDGKGGKAEIPALDVRALPVTNEEMLAFVLRHPEWRRDKVATIFADAGYLAHWSTATRIKTEQAKQPVTRVSWFAASAFCEAEGARLPTWHEWEYLAAADATRADARKDPAWRDRILAWYARPSSAPLPSVGGAPNVYKVRDLHGLVWEWVDDFGGLMVASDSRKQGDPDTMKFCGSGAVSMQDKENYAVLMRVAMLSSLKARDTTKNVGFRCVREVKEKPTS